MVATFTPNSDAGGTIHLPSPSHIRHVDPTSAFRQLRRSLSRSPSKTAGIRLASPKSITPSPHSPLLPKREASPQWSLSQTISSPSRVTSPLSLPCSASGKKGRPLTRKPSPIGASSRTPNPSRSPGRKTLAESSDQGNATPKTSRRSSDDVENFKIGLTTETFAENIHKSIAVSVPEHASVQNPALVRLEKGSGNWVESRAKSSPLKRSDGVMNLDQGSFGSPSAKRRSLHGASFAADFDIFDNESAREGRPNSRSERTYTESTGSFDQPNVSTPLPKRTSSLRRTTLQQRHDKPSFARSKLSNDLGVELNTTGPNAQKSRYRMSLDNFLPSVTRESPFSSQGGLPNASAHPIPQQTGRVLDYGQQVHTSRHPLSRTMTQSSSNSSMAEDSPTHIPLRQPEQRRQVVNFSKSLPIGTARPASSGGASHESSSQGLSTHTSFATPDNYRLAKPLPAAFMSTGLISKRNKNIEDNSVDFNDSKGHMPDTPCKRHSVMGLTTPAPATEATTTKARQVRHSFGTPSTPFNPHSARPVSTAFGKGVSIFGSGLSAGSVNRRGSFASVDGEDSFHSPSNKFDSQSSAGYGVLSTPTKQCLAVGTNVIETPSHDSEFSGEAVLPSADANCKSVQFGSPVGSADGDSDGMMDESPSTALKFRSYSSVPNSFTLSRTARNFRSPTPLTKTYHTAPARLKSPRAKADSLSPASPIQSLFGRLSPQTPREVEIPPDPSRLSISTYTIEPAIQPMDNILRSSMIFPPATPTASRDSSVHFRKPRSSLNSSKVTPPVEVDPCLTSKFDKVELIGTGVFSHVYRVTSSQELRVNSTNYSIPTTRTPPTASLPLRVWAVKKSRNAYIGPKDRQRKLLEATTLKSLGQSDHVLQLFDTWEERNHLYIQTEYCEEGSLDLFLDQVGRKARLDDFRIWKILLELSLGLKHIHDSGFIHLDLKPANVLITFEGVLKIADFGMATRWPAQPGIDGEGDREYIGPEILRGQFDKPSDIFALGLIMLEIAGNVMLPDNGVSWQRLRSGDMSDVPSLTFSSETSNILRDSSGKPLGPEASIEDFYGSDSEPDDFGSPYFLGRRAANIRSQPKILRTGELIEPPNFMVDKDNEQALDNVVRWMISPDTADRPLVDQILGTTGVQWVEARRRAGATIFEGNWGPADDVLGGDTQMADV
ncbi:MAG: hypothetical protein LQ351_000709 [Letrouitia transgressa]|nr:MAG: hypothetical protein LQ351_000709 [Letrouitia transgressa]